MDFIHEKLHHLPLPSLTQLHLSLLEAPLTNSEITKALFQMKPDKTPGSDGLPVLFFQKFWHLIHEDVSPRVILLNPSETFAQ